MTDKIIGVKELRENIDKYAAQVKAGRSITVVKRSEPLFRLTPVDDDDDANWETLIDFRTIPGYENGMPADEFLKALREVNEEEGQKKYKASQKRLSAKK
jgi:prevent-host-death family protein